MTWFINERGSGNETFHESMLLVVSRYQRVAGRAAMNGELVFDSYFRFSFGKDLIKHPIN